MKLIILLFILTIQVSAQKLKYIPDINLRNELKKEGFVTNDSLDIVKIQGRLQLELSGKGIENLDGLQYFNQVWNLQISNNKIKQLENLPLNLTQLNCSNNDITQIDKLPEHLKYLICSYNKINIIENLPNPLISLVFSNNQMTHLPQLTNNLQFINYSNNPIPHDSLPSLFQNINCDDLSQNCLPYEFMKWKILNATIKDTSIKITEIKIKLVSSYSWGFGSQVETIDFKSNKSKLSADKMQIKRTYDKLNQKDKKDSTYFKKIKYSVDIYKINQIINDIFLNKMSIQIQVGDSIKSINLKNKKNGETCFSDCMDGTYYNLEYTIFSKLDSIKLNYHFNSCSSNGVTICSTNGPENINSILDWLYIYKLTNLTICNEETVKYFFNKNNLDRVIKWAK